MITPMTSDGGVDYNGAARLAEYLVTEMRNDGLVISGTTGESPTTSDSEKERLLRTVLEAVGDRATVVAGVGTNDTAHTCELARRPSGPERTRCSSSRRTTTSPAERPGGAFQPGGRRDRLPMMLYDIPGRTGTPIATETPGPARRAPADRRGQGR